MYAKTDIFRINRCIEVVTRKVSALLLSSLPKVHVVGTLGVKLRAMGNVTKCLLIRLPFGKSYTKVKFGARAYGNGIKSPTGLVGLFSPCTSCFLIIISSYPFSECLSTSSKLTLYFNFCCLYLVGSKLGKVSPGFDNRLPWLLREGLANRKQSWLPFFRRRNSISVWRETSASSNG